MVNRMTQPVTVLPGFDIRPSKETRAAFANQSDFQWALLYSRSVFDKKQIKRGPFLSVKAAVTALNRTPEFAPTKNARVQVLFRSKAVDKPFSDDGREWGVLATVFPEHATGFVSSHGVNPSRILQTQLTNRENVLRKPKRQGLFRIRRKGL